ncbi:MAG TPA: DUF3596 domain-containing protein [Burkholderiales bacterium]|mgnify:CR=1 FL=1|nr:DUF3596 domain-containing protein [Burkholderiales bacterium]
MDRTIINHAGIEISDSGKSIRIIFMFKNIRCRETINLQPTKANIKYCTNLRAEILNKIAKNEFNYADYFPESKLAKRLGLIKEQQVIHCSSILEKQLTNYAKMVENGYMSPSTFDGYRKIIKGQLIPSFGKYNITDITASLIREWISALEATPKTIRNYLTPLRNMFADAINEELVKENPIEQIALSKLIQIASKKSEFDAEPFDEIEKQTIINSANGQTKNLLRISELIALKWADIDFKQGVASISRAKVCNVEKGTKTKSGTRTIIILPKALEALTNQLKFTKDNEYIFNNPNTNNSWSSSKKVAEHWRYLLKMTNVKYRNCYQMRHTFASTLLSNGENPWWVATQMGHVDVEMIFKKYGKWIPKKDEIAGYNFVGKY